MIIAGTGHRPKYCPCKYKDPHPWLTELRASIHNAFSSDITAVISGMAIGWDTWLAQEALNAGIPVHAYVPFKGQGSKWPTASRNEYERILSLSDKVIYCAEEYDRGVFLLRDRMMVDAADQMWALLNPAAESGGTHYTVKFAESQGVSVTNFWRD